MDEPPSQEAIAAEGGPSAVTVAAITARLKAPTGSFYHRFASRDALLAELWFDSVMAFQHGIRAALDANDGLAAALHTPRWARANLSRACLLLLHHRDDFLHGEWPQSLQDNLAEHRRQSEARIRAFARREFGRAGPGEIRRAQFVLAEMPIAAVRQHLARREKPPPIVDTLIETAYSAVVAAGRRLTRA